MDIINDLTRRHPNLKISIPFKPDCPNAQSRDNKEALMKRIGEKWRNFIAAGTWTIHSDLFWTYPHDYR